jgi:hypothetical protein
MGDMVQELAPGFEKMKEVSIDAVKARHLNAISVYMNYHKADFLNAPLFQIGFQEEKGNR